MKCHATLIATALVLSAAAGARAADVPAAAIDTAATHVRALNPAGIALVANAREKSATVRDLAHTLDSSNLVAYVQVTPLPKFGPESGLIFIGASAAQRFVMVSVSSDVSAERQMELLGHELLHATDVARTSWVTSDTQFQTLMSLVGWRDVTRSTGYETGAATAIERQVRKEIAHGR